MILLVFSTNEPTRGGSQLILIVPQPLPVVRKTRFSARRVSRSDITKSITTGPKITTAGVDWKAGKLPQCLRELYHILNLSIIAAMGRLRQVEKTTIRILRTDKRSTSCVVVVRPGP